MIFLDPKSDIAFKKLFGDIAHKNILISFLNSVLERIEGEKIVEVIINDPSNVAETPLSKTSIVDVRCTDQKNNQYIIEMQVITQKDYAARAQYYSALALSRQLASGENYDKLVPENLKNSVLEEAFNVLAQSNWSKKELEAYDKYLDAIRSAASQLDTAFEKGIAKGLEKGMEKGIAKGEKKKAIEIAKQLLGILDIETIANKTGLSFDEVRNLKNK